MFAISAVLRPIPMSPAGASSSQASPSSSDALLLLPYGRTFYPAVGDRRDRHPLCLFFGVAFLPHLSIHQASDVAEPELAGDWRGFFTHKNGAGAGMVLLIFIGLFVYRAWNRFVGIAIAGAAAVFLYFTHSKSPTNLLPVVLLLSYVVPRVRGVVPMLALVVGVPLLIDLLTVGSVMSNECRVWSPR